MKAFLPAMVLFATAAMPGQSPAAPSVPAPPPMVAPERLAGFRQCLAARAQAHQDHGVCLDVYSEFMRHCRVTNGRADIFRSGGYVVSRTLRRAQCRL